MFFLYNQNYIIFLKGFILVKELLYRFDFKLVGILLLPLIFVFCIKFMCSNISHSICIFKFITGHDCWGCGMIRAFNALFNFQFVQAYNYNTRIVIVAPLMLCIWLQTLYNYFKRKNNHTVCD